MKLGFMQASSFAALRPRLIAVILGIALAIAALAILRSASKDTGYVRDEGAYFEASRRYGAWSLLLAQDPARALELRARDRGFAFNHEHPAGLKIVAGWIMAARLDEPFDPTRQTKLPWNDHAAQDLRLAAQVVAAAGAGFLGYLAATAFGPAIGLYCGVLCLALPRVFYHAQLHCFDVAVAVFTLLVVVAFGHFVQKPGPTRALGLGLLWGLALSIKHNAWFLPPVLLLLAVSHRGLQRETKEKAPLMALLGWGLISVILGIAVFVAAWPWLWHDPMARFIEYYRFHAEHNFYNVEYFSQNYNQPPLPASYPWVMTAATVPLSALLLYFYSGWRVLSTVVQQKLCFRRWSFFWLSILPLALIAAPNTPIFGGTKHWLSAYFFAIYLAGYALHRLLQHPLTAIDSHASPQAPPHRTWFHRLRARSLRLAAVFLLLIPPSYDTWRSHPHQLAQYAGWMGGPRSAANLGLQRSFWGGLCLPQLLEGRGDAQRSLYPHDAHPWAIAPYRSEGRLPDLKVHHRNRADYALQMRERHFLLDEIATINAFGQTVPVHNCTLDGVPLTSLYARPKSEDPKTVQPKNR